MHSSCCYRRCSVGKKVLLLFVTLTFFSRTVSWAWTTPSCATGRISSHHSAGRRHVFSRLHDKNQHDDHDPQEEAPQQNKVVFFLNKAVIASWMVAFQVAIATTMTLPVFLPMQPAQAQAAASASASAQEQVVERSSSSSSSSSVAEEVYTYMNKYYLNKYNHNKDDWANILHSKSSNNNNLNSVSEMVAEMVRGDDGAKYNRILSQPEYQAIQRFDLIGVGATFMPQEQQNDQGANPKETTTTATTGSSKEKKKSTSRIIVGAPPIPSSPADKAGLKVGDVVLEVNGVSTTGRTAFDIIDQITQGDDDSTESKGTTSKQAATVTMTILPKQYAQYAYKDNKDEAAQYARQVTMERSTDAAVQNPIRYKLVSGNNNNINDDDNNNIGYIRISEFNSMVVPKLKEAVQTLQSQQDSGVGAKALILDLRHNTGGAFQSAIEIASLFLSDRVATYVVDNSSTRLAFTTAKNQVVVRPDVPVAIWVDGRSASAAEVLAASLHDNCRAVLVGSEHSFGKGLIQGVYGLKNGAGLVLTVAKYLSPSGNEIQGKGIQPDIAVAVSQSSPLPQLPSMLGLGVPDVNDADAKNLDWNDIRHRLSPTMCQVPPSMGAMTTTAVAKSN